MFGIDKDSLVIIQDTAKKSAELRLVPMPNDPTRHLLIGNGTDKVIETPYIPPPRRHVVESLEAFAAAYARWANDSDDIGLPPDAADAAADSYTRRLPNVWVDLGKEWRLVFFTDEPLRRSWVKLRLTASPQWETMNGFREAKALDQKQLVRLLRHDLAGCVDPGALAAFRSVDFQKIQNYRAQQQHAKQSLDADIVAAVVSGPLPEELVVRFPVFAMGELREFTVVVQLTIDVDADGKRFILQALPGQLDIAIDEGRRLVIDRIDGELGSREFANTCILTGSPGKASEAE